MPSNGLARIGCLSFCCLAMLAGSLQPVHAHAGVTKTAGNVDVFLKQSPLSPFVGEKVAMTFILFHHDSTDQWRYQDVTLRLIDTFYGDESRDTTLLEQQYKTDANGVITFEYTFPKENYFDVELSFVDSAGTLQAVGFLVQPRMQRVSVQYTPGILAGLLLSLIAMLSWRRMKKAPQIARSMIILLGVLAICPMAFAHGGNETVVQKQVGDYLAEFSYDFKDIRTGEPFDFHSSLMKGAGTNQWDFGQYTKIDFEIRRGSGATVYTKSFATTALGFAAYEFPEPGGYRLVVRFVDGANDNKTTAEVVFPLDVKRGNPADNYFRASVAAPLSPLTILLRLGACLAAAAVIFWLLQKRRSSLRKRQ